MRIIRRGISKIENVLDKVKSLDSSISGSSREFSESLPDKPLEGIKLPTLEVQTTSGVNKQTMIFVGVALLGAWFLFKKRK